jgi:hypothetical protein
LLRPGKRIFPGDPDIWLEALVTARCMVNDNIIDIETRKHARTERDVCSGLGGISPKKLQREGQ